MILIAQHFLSVLVWLPILGGLMLLVLGDGGDARSSRASMMRVGALLITLVTFVLSTALFTNFDNAETGMQFVERTPWIQALNSFYYPGRPALAIENSTMNAAKIGIVLATPP